MNLRIIVLWFLFLWVLKFIFRLLVWFVNCRGKGKSRIGDVMRTPSKYDLSAHFLCNLPASVKRLPRRAQPAIGQRSVLGFLIVIDESPDQTDAAVGDMSFQRTFSDPCLNGDAKIRAFRCTCKFSAHIL